MHLLIVGYGSAGRRHLAAARALVPGLRVTLLRRPGGDTGAGAGAEAVVHDLAAALAAKPDLAVVATPAPLHLEAATALVAAGVPVLVEKPLADSPAGVPDLLRAQAARGTPLLVGYCLRHDRAWSAVGRALADGRIGAPVWAGAQVGQYLPDWRPGTDHRAGVSGRADLGGGVLLELSHEIDLLRAALGEVAAVTASLGRVGGLGVEVEDCADLILHFAGGAMGNLHLDMVQRAPVRQCRIAGAEGTLEWDGIARTARLYTAAAGRWQVLDDGAGADVDAMFRAQFAHFLDCAAGRCPPRVTAADGLRVLEVVAAARHSARAGREAPVRRVPLGEAGGAAAP
ncbi:MAG: Gfo/Idh/MocA family oxidoreductase [Hyphomicrobiales bacterium]|nr:Gfo/Idh/MocA family oxidoreductase [Hyphomicrobiales bacterium]